MFGPIFLFSLDQGRDLGSYDWVRHQWNGFDRENLLGSWHKKPALKKTAAAMFQVSLAQLSLGLPCQLQSSN